MLNIFKNGFENKNSTSYIGIIRTNVLKNDSNVFFEIKHPCLIVNKNNIQQTYYSFTHDPVGIPCSNKNQFFTEVVNVSPNQVIIMFEAPKLLTWQSKLLEFAYFIQTKNQIIFNNSKPLRYKQDNLIQKLDEEYKSLHSLFNNNKQIEEKIYLNAFDYLPELTFNDKTIMYNIIVDSMENISHNNDEIIEKALKLKKSNNNKLNIEHYKNTVIFQEKINKLNAI